MLAGLRALARSGLESLLARYGYVYFKMYSSAYYAQDSLFTTNSAHFRHQPSFRAAYNRGVLASGGVDSKIEWRLHVALWAARLELRAPGDFVECGVNAGFVSSAVMTELHWETQDRAYYLIDTFAGPVSGQYSAAEAGRLALARDALARGAYVMDLERVRKNFAEWPNAMIVQGCVPEVLSSLGLSQVAFLHLDMNCAFPEVAALEALWPALKPGGVVLLDDYCYFGQGSIAQAVDALAALAARIGFHVLSIPTGQGLILKQ